MSVNLVARTRDGEIQLWQTPTQITYTILPPSLGLTKKGREAREALMRYIEWIRHSIDGVWEDEEALKWKRDLVMAHIDYVSQFLDDKSLVVSVI